MEFNLSHLRLGLLALLIAVFWLFGGFSIPPPDASNLLDHHRFAKAWRYCVIVYLIGAGSVSIVDHYVGNLDRMNIRLLYIILGTILMIGSSLWLKGLRETVSPKTTGITLSVPATINT